MTCDLRRLRLKGFISRKPGTTRYELTPYGRHTIQISGQGRLPEKVLPPHQRGATHPMKAIDLPTEQVQERRPTRLKPGAPDGDLISDGDMDPARCQPPDPFHSVKHAPCEETL